LCIPWGSDQNLYYSRVEGHAPMILTGGGHAMLT